MLVVDTSGPFSQGYTTDTELLTRAKSPPPPLTLLGLGTTHSNPFPYSPCPHLTSQKTITHPYACLPGSELDQKSQQEVFKTFKGASRPCHPLQTILIDSLHRL